MAIKLDRNACDKIRPIDSQACHLLTRALTKTGRDPGIGENERNGTKYGTKRKRV